MNRRNKSVGEQDPLAFLSGDSEMGCLIRSMDWSATPLGPVASWPQSLRTTISLCLASNLPINVIWGPQHIQIYNDGYRPLCGAKHPRSMGLDYKECWSSAWPALHEAFESACAGRSAFLENQRMFLDRNSCLEETFFTFSLSPICDETGNVGGLFHPVTEMTQTTLAERRLKLLRDLADGTADAKTVQDACALIPQTLADHQLDLPFVLLYSLTADGTAARLAGIAGLAPGTRASRERVDLAAEEQPNSWPLAEVARTGRERQVDDLEHRFGALPCGPYPEPPRSAFVLPIAVPGLEHPLALLVAGVSSRRALDDPYRTFYAMLRESVTNVLVCARAYEVERSKAEALAELRADDYSVEPFRARELLVRGTAHLQMAKLRREVSASLRASEERFQSFMANSPVTAYIKDAEGRYLFVNRLIEQKLNRPLAEWVGCTDFDVFPAEQAEQLQINDRSVLTSRTAAQFVETISHPDKVHYYLSLKFPLQGDDGHWLLAGMSLDMTEQREAEERLRTAEVRWRTMTETLPNLVWTDLPDGQCDWLSCQWGKFTGIPENELLGLRWLEKVIHPDDRERTLACWSAACADQGEYDLEYRIRRYDGEYHWFKTRGVPIRDNHGEITYWFGSCTDIEDIKRLEAALRDADRKKDEFLATLAHELRNPLAPLRNGLHLLKLARNDAKAIEQALPMMERQLMQMVRLIDDLLDISRIGRGKIELRKECIDLAKIVLQAVETSRPLIEAAGLHLTVHMPPEPIFVNADITRMAQVFCNLLNNAAKFTERGGRVSLRVERQSADVLVRVKDTGVGIPAHMLTRVFDTFTQIDRALERAQGGLGIGLSLVKGLVEMHGGSVEAKSDGHGMGSEIVVRQPVLPVPDEEQRLDDDSVRAAPTVPHRILVADDNPDAATSLAVMLKIMGNDTRAAFDGCEALEIAMEFRPDVVLLDIGMPRLNGYDAARRIRQQPWGKNVVLVALTGWGQDEDRRRSLEAGFNFHVVKPVEPAALSELLARVRTRTG